MEAAWLGLSASVLQGMVRGSEVLPLRLVVPVPNVEVPPERGCPARRLCP